MLMVLAPPRTFIQWLGDAPSLVPTQTLIQSLGDAPGPGSSPDPYPEAEGCS